MLSLVEDYLKRYGWSYRVSSPNQLMSGWSSDAGRFELNVMVLDHFVCFESVIMDLGQSVGHGHLFRLFETILCWNQTLRFVKLSVSEDLKLILSCDVLRTGEGLSYEAFEQVLGTMGHYADVFKDELTSRHKMSEVFGVQGTVHLI